MEQSWEEKAKRTNNEAITRTLHMLVHFANESISSIGNNSDAYNAILTAESMIDFYAMALEVVRLTDPLGMHIYKLNSTD